MKDDIKEFRIVVVASKFENDCYDKLWRPAIRAIDALHKEDESRKRFRFIHNGVRSGPLSDMHKVLNSIENGMRGRGFFVQREIQKMDLLMDGPDSEAKWLQEQAQGADLIFVIDDGKLRNNVRETLKNLDVYTMEVKV